MRRRILTAVLAAVLAIGALGWFRPTRPTQATPTAVVTRLEHQVVISRQAATKRVEGRLNRLRHLLRRQRHDARHLRRRLKPVAIAQHFLGVPYVWGGSSPSGFDCSGLVRYVFAKIGVSLPHLAAAQMGYGHPVSTRAIEPGDLVFYENGGHVAIYVGHGRIIQAPHSGAVVSYAPVREMPISAIRRVV